MVWKEPGKDKDPWGNDGQQSSELDKLVESMQRRLNSLLGTGRRRGRRKRNPHPLSWLLPLFLVLWLGSGCYAVDGGDRGVNFLFGRLQNIATPGLNWHVPWPLGSSVIVNGVDAGADYVRGYPSLPSADGNAVSVEVSVHYQIVDIPQYLFGNANPGDGAAAAGILARLTDTAVSNAVAHASLPDLLGQDVESAETAAREQLTGLLHDYDIGLVVTHLELRKLTVPTAVAAAYAGVRQAEDEAHRQQDEAEAYARDLLPRTRGEGDRNLLDAHSYATDVVQRAQGDAAAFEQLLPAYRRAPALTRDSLYRDTFEQLLGQVNKVVVLSDKDRVALSFDHLCPAPAPAAVTAAARPKAAGGGGG